MKLRGMAKKTRPPHEVTTALHAADRGIPGKGIPIGLHTRPKEGHVDMLEFTWTRKGPEQRVAIRLHFAGVLSAVLAFLRLTT